MNPKARDSIHKTKEALKSAEENLQIAANEAENTNIKNQIKNQLTEVTNSLEECQKIASGLSQYRTEKKFEGIHH